MEVSNKYTKSNSETQLLQQTNISRTLPVAPSPKMGNRNLRKDRKTQEDKLQRTANEKVTTLRKIARSRNKKRSVIESTTKMIARKEGNTNLKKE